MSGSAKLVRGPGSLCYRLRVSRRRRSVGLTITDTGDLVVHAPQGLSQEVIHRVIAKNRAWIDHKQAECQKALSRLKAGEVYYLGEAFRVQIIPRRPAGIHVAQQVFHLALENPQADPWPQLQDWYRQEAAALLTEKVRYFAACMELAPPRLEVRNWRRRWGECRADGHLRFNWRLILLPPEITDYVVVHELAHLLVPGHNPKFWRQVGRYLPDYAERRRWLKVYGSPLLFWKFDAQEDIIRTSTAGYLR
jgi:predicted metal-dependent hydrolase